MNIYYRAIGFSTVKSLHQQNRLIKDALSNPDRRVTATLSLNKSLFQIDRFYNKEEAFGISVLGEMDSDGDCLTEYAFPYVKPAFYPFEDEIPVEKIYDRDAYYGVIDNVTLCIIFFMQNVAEITQRSWHDRLPKRNQVCLSGLSVSARVLLPLERSMEEIQQDEAKKFREMLDIRRARTGDPYVLDRMMDKEMRLKDSLDRRVMHEDIMSIVNTSIIPHTLQGDIYDIIGNIVHIEMHENQLTNERIYLLDVQSLYYMIRIAINEKDLEGEPLVGRRFRGVTWLQGLLVLDRP
ncbi:MAG: DUF3881 family protein [Eubacterium sp.]|nr:DUF3881 family protein [Eubacterium sp.]